MNITKLKELSAVIKKIGKDCHDNFTEKFLVELLDGHIKNLEKENENRINILSKDYFNG